MFNVFEYLVCCGGMALLMLIVIGSAIGWQEFQLEWNERRKSKQKN